MDFKNKKVCANCSNVYLDYQSVNYDHFEPHRCKAMNGKECCDIFNSVCDKFSPKITHKQETDKMLFDDTDIIDIKK